VTILPREKSAKTSLKWFSILDKHPLIQMGCCAMAKRQRCTGLLRNWNPKLPLNFAIWLH